MNAILNEAVEQMKFILNGRTFDNSTSQTVAISRGSFEPHQFDDEFRGAESVRYEDVLYRTAKGSFFAHHHRTAKYQRGKPVVSDSALELTPETAVQWIENEQAIVVDPTGLTLPDEA